ncbi:MAG: DUF1015 domain-containing protein [Eubacterium sp.]|nr:DUF1015 domain-containing protein [Eubacterium sp.]
MAVIRPFAAYRPDPEVVSEVAALPYDVYNRKEAKEEVARTPKSFLAIDRPESTKPDDFDMYSDEAYATAKKLLDTALQDGTYLQEDMPVYYIYELVMDGRSQTGLVACASIDDYVNGVIKKHENTREEKEQDRIRHIDTCDAQTGPIFLAYREQPEISVIIRCIQQDEEPVYDFTAPDGVTHRVWVIDDPADIQALEKEFAELDRIYIADGHHRAASAVKVGLLRRKENPDYKGTEEFNYFLSVLFPDSELAILPYNRVVKDWNGRSEEQFMQFAEGVCEIRPSDKPVQPEKKGVVGCFTGGKWYELSFRKELMNDDPVEGLDVSLLQKNLLEPFFGIEDPRTSDRIDFVGGIRGLGELEKRVAEDAVIAFSMYPTSIQELFSVADAGLLMPPKSTWFEPKLRSGIFIHKLSEQ